MEGEFNKKYAPFYSQYQINKDFQSLDAWKKCQAVKPYFYYTILPKLPSIENYNLNLQIRRAAVSITANIAEGYGWYHFTEGVQFYRISRSSLYELKDHLISCLELNYITQKEANIAINLIESAKTTLNGFIKFVNEKIRKKG
jgi:four helix bundle protein